MKTDALIRALALDGARPVVPIGRRLGVALLVGTALAAILFVLVLGARPDIGEASGTVRFLFKLGVLVALAVTAGAYLVDAARPLARSGLRWLFLAPLLLVAGVALELSVMPTETWGPRLIGRNAPHCLSLIPLFSLAPLVCVLIALKSGAPSRPASAGAIAGLLCGAVGATLYALSCPDDSPLFVATWYPIAIGAVTAAAAYGGKRLLRW